MKIPYNELDIMVASIGLEGKLDAISKELGGEDKVLAVLVSAVGNITNDNFTAKCAEHYGVTPADLINSPNYSTLKEDFEQVSVGTIIKNIETGLKLTNVEAWALFAQAQGRCETTID